MHTYVHVSHTHTHAHRQTDTWDCLMDGMILFPRWSHDGKYFARLSTDRLSVYETSVSAHMTFGCLL